MSNKNLSQLDTFTTWLGDVYQDNADLTKLLNNAGFNEIEIEHIKQDHLDNFLTNVIDLMTHNGFDQRDLLMVRCYGLKDGQPKDYYTISGDYGVCGNRIRQLVTRQVELYRDPERKTELQNALTTIGRQLLDDQNSTQR